MPDGMTVDAIAAELPVPACLEEALDPAWLARALAPLSGGAPVTAVTVAETIETMAAKIRFTAQLEGEAAPRHFCLKAFLTDPGSGAGLTAVREARFYTDIAPHITTRTPQALSIVDAAGRRAVLIMEDLVHAGAHFCSALEPFTAETAAATLDQIARLHAGSALLDGKDWIPSRLAYLATGPHFTADRLQQLMDHPRFAALSARTGNAALLLDGMKRLADRFAGGAMTILHGDCHAGNFYMTADGPGLTDWQLLQRGCWAQDVAYHIAAVLPVEVAEREERALLDHYVDAVRRHGGAVPDPATAWDDFRAAQIYGYYHWAITTRVDPAITDVFVGRLGAAVDRHGTYDLLGL